MRRRTRERERHRQEILECAGRLFADRGFERTTMQDISSASGFALASIYKHFAGKEQIYDALVGEAVRLYFDELARQFAKLDSPLERIRAAVEITVAHIERHREISLVILTQLRGLGRPQAEGSSAPSGFDARAGYLSVLRFFEQLFVEARDRGEILSDVDPHAVALTTIGAMLVHMIYWLHYAGPDERMDAGALLRVVLGPVAAR